MSAAPNPSLTDKQRELIPALLEPRNRKPTQREIDLFVMQCERTGLDPFARQIYAQYRTSKGQERMTIQATIDGLRLVAERTGKYAGQSGPYWCGQDGEWRDVWLDRGKPAAAKSVVCKVIADRVVDTPAVAKYAEYDPGERNRMWTQMSALMIAKCAEALALRKAFPQELSGLYTAEEMQQADAPTPEFKAKLGAIMEEDREILDRLGDAEEVTGEVEIDPLPTERVEQLIELFRAEKMRYADITMALGAAGLDGLRAHSQKAIQERLEELTPEQADALQGVIVSAPTDGGQT